MTNRRNLIFLFYFTFCRFFGHNFVALPFHLSYLFRAFIINSQICISHMRRDEARQEKRKEATHVISDKFFHTPHTSSTKPRNLIWIFMFLSCNSSRHCSLSLPGRSNNFNGVSLVLFQNTATRKRLLHSSIFFFNEQEKYERIYII